MMSSVPSIRRRSGLVLLTGLTILAALFGWRVVSALTTEIPTRDGIRLDLGSAAWPLCVVATIAVVLAAIVLERDRRAPDATARELVAASALGCVNGAYYSYANTTVDDGNLLPAELLIALMALNMWAAVVRMQTARAWVRAAAAILTPVATFGGAMLIAALR